MNIKNWKQGCSAEDGERGKEQFQRTVAKARSGNRESLRDSLLQLLFTVFPIHEIPSKNYGLWKHPSDEGLPDPKCLKNVEQNYAIINEFIFVVKLWVNFTPKRCYNVFPSCFLLQLQHMHTAVRP